MGSRFIDRPVGMALRVMIFVRSFGGETEFAGPHAGSVGKGAGRR